MAAWAEFDIFGKHEYGFEYDFEGGGFRLIGTDTVEGLKQEAANPPPSTYYYDYTFTVPDVLTVATLSVQWPAQSGTQSVQVRLGDQGDFLTADQFDVSTVKLDVLRLTRRRRSTWTSPARRPTPTAPLPETSYALRLVSSVQFATEPTFVGAFSFPPPSIETPVPTDPRGARRPTSRSRP